MKVSAFEKKIVHYLKQMPPRMIGLESLNLIEILDMTPGAYNLNYHVRVNEKKFIFRINIEQQSGLSNQIEVEFMVLKFLESQSIAPKVLHFDDSKKHFDFDILIEEYLEGPHLSLGQDVSEVADLLAKLHSLKPVKICHASPGKTPYRIHMHWSAVIWKNMRPKKRPTAKQSRWQKQY